MEVLQRGAWLESLLVAPLQRYRSSPPHHLARLHLGAKTWDYYVFDRRERPSCAALPISPAAG
ncbi:MAG: hypothetical protein EOR07_33725 [Mesorhizobium sp.]|nr:MAG: hypothetical protein EOR07_33725 [Mesorhizobium sp.]